MRRLALILLLGTSFAGDDPALHEKRAWRGVVEVSSISQEPPVGKGREIQKERVEFVLLTEPPRTTLGWPRLPMRMREGVGSFELKTDVASGEGENAIARKGSAKGRLYPKVAGVLEPTRNKYKFRVQVSPSVLVATTTISGFWQGRFATLREPLSRRPFLLEFEAGGEVEGDGGVLTGRRTLLDRSQTLDRDVTITWRIERVDPVLAGRVTDHNGRPIPGLDVLARHTNAQRRKQRLPPLLRRAKTDADGRYAIDAFFALWTLQVVGVERDGVVVEGARDAVELKFDDAPKVDFRLNAYRHAALPQPRLLTRHFQGDVAGYLDYMRHRVPEQRLKLALLPASE